MPQPNGCKTKPKKLHEANQHLRNYHQTPFDRFLRGSIFLLSFYNKNMRKHSFVWFCAVFHQWSSLCSFGITWRVAHHFKARKVRTQKKERKYRKRCDTVVILMIKLMLFFATKFCFRFRISIKDFASSTKANYLAF